MEERKSNKVATGRNVLAPCGRGGRTLYLPFGEARFAYRYCYGLVSRGQHEYFGGRVSVLEPVSQDASEAERRAQFDEIAMRCQARGKTSPNRVKTQDRIG